MRVSVIVPTCGRSKLLKDALRSIHEQTYQNIEIILVADRPIDHLEVGVDRIEYVYPKPHHKNVAVSINRGLCVASGDLIAYLCDDDLWVSKTRIERIVEEFVDGVVLVADQARWVRADGIRVPQSAIGDYCYRKPYEVGHEQLVMDVATHSDVNFLVHDCVVHRNVQLRWETSQYYNDHYTPCDWHYWCDLVYHTKGKVKVLPNVGVEAFYPGAWRIDGLTEEKALLARYGEIEMKKDRNVSEVLRYARNIGTKVEIIPADHRHKDLEIPPNGTVRVDWVTTSSGELYPNFVVDWESEAYEVVVPTRELPKIDEGEHYAPSSFIQDDRQNDESIPVDDTVYEMSDLEKKLYGELMEIVFARRLHIKDMSKRGMIDAILNQQREVGQK